jgi:RNA polymerase sigma-70 factor (ECF subfamily)
MQHYKRWKPVGGNILISKDDFAEQAIALRSRQYRVAWAMLKNEADCSDAMQEALTKAWAARRNLRDDALFSTWLMRILINECKSILRQRKRQFLISEPEADAYVGNPIPDVQYLVDELPDNLRLPFVLHHIEGYPIKEVARLLSTTSSAIKNKVFRARNMLKSELDYNAPKEVRVQ